MHKSDKTNKYVHTYITIYAYIRTALTSPTNLPPPPPTPLQRLPPEAPPPSLSISPPSSPRPPAPSTSNPPQ